MGSIVASLRSILRTTLGRSIAAISLIPALVAVVVLATFDLLLSPPRLIFFAGAYMLMVLTLAGGVGYYVNQIEHSRALQADEVFQISNDTLPHLKTGLSEESASAVARIVKQRSDAIAVAITDRSRVLGFAGAGEDHHVVGGPLITQATRAALVANERQIVPERHGIGCPEPGCPLGSAIVVPLEQKGQAVGALKFYYDDPAMLTESRIAVAEGLARLLSTQLELSEVELQRELACAAELKALQAQINPHFLFNTLNTIAMLCRTNPERARWLLIEFAHFFRSSLENADELVTLRRELDYVHSYLVFERARFGDRLQVEEKVDPELESIVLPAFTLQPLVENAVKHALSEGATLDVLVEVARDNGTASIVVRDNGIGIAPDALPHVMEPGFGTGIGIGLGNVDARLKGLFGAEYGLTIDSRLGGGTTVTMTVPTEDD